MEFNEGQNYDWSCPFLLLVKSITDSLDSLIRTRNRRLLAWRIMTITEAIKSNRKRS